MKREIRNLKLAILVTLFFACRSFGFDATLSIQPPLIALNESATLSVEVRGAKNPQSPALPDVPGLRFVSAGQSTQMNWVNGKSDSFTSFTFQVYPQKTGTFSIGPFDYKIGSETKKLGGQLKVVSGGNSAQQAQSWSDLLFAKLTSSHDSMYVQEPFELTLSVYSRQGVQLAGNINLTGMPETGLADLKWQEVQPTRDVVNGAVYDVRRFHAQTRAISSGVFDFSPVVTAQVAVPNQNNARHDPFFNSFFNRVETRPVDLPVEKTVITVKPLPEEGKPSRFSGAVGQFNFQVRAQPLEVNSGDPVTLTMTISGNGNFDRVLMPALPVSDHFRLFGEPVRKSSENSVQFEQVISPRTADTLEIPAIPFSFFDTQSGQYRTINSAAIPLKVTAISNNTAQVFAAKDSMILPPPQTPFATESDVQRIESAIQSTWNKIRPWLWIGPALLLIWLTVLFSRKLHQHRRKNTARVRRQKAPKAARKALRAASHAQKHGNSTAFHDALWSAMADYFGHRLNLPPGDVTASTVLPALTRSGFDPEKTNELRVIFEQVEARRYGFQGAEIPENPQALLRDLEQILKLCEKAKI